MHPELVAHLDRHGVVTPAAARRWLTPGQLRAALARGELERVWHGVLARRGCGGLLPTRLAGLALLADEPVTACLATAAELYGFGVDPDEVVHVLAPATHLLGGRPGLAVHQRRGAPVGGRGGLRLTLPAWTAVEVARTQTSPRALATLDAALRSRRVTHDRLCEALRAQAGRRGTRCVTRVLPWADGAAESPMESETRFVLLRAGLPAPALQHPVRDGHGRVLHRLDLAWPAALVAVEYDGVEFHSSRESLARDRARTGWLLERGWTLLPVTADDVRRRPEQLASRVAALLAR